MIAGGQRAIVSSARVWNVLKEEPTITERPHARHMPAGGGEITFSDVTFAYQDNRPVLENFTLEVPAGASLEVSIRSSADTTLAVRAPSGRVECDDDSGGYPNPLLRFPARDAAGTYEVYVGVFAGDHASVTLQATAL